jgi:hypothetical protein
LDKPAHFHSKKSAYLAFLFHQRRSLALANKLARATFGMMKDQTMFDAKKIFRCSL